MSGVRKCSSGGKTGYKWGHSGTCYTYDRNDRNEEAAARARATAEGLDGKRFEEEEDD